MNKRVHEIAKERGLPAKEVLTRLKAAGLDVKAASSSVDETAAQRVLGNGEAPVAKAPVAKAPVAKAPVAKAPVAKAPVAKAPVAKAPVAKASPDRAAPAIQTRTAAATKAPEGVPDPAPRAGEVNGAPLDGDGDGDGDARSANSEAAHKRPTRDSLQGERTPGTPGGRRRVVIDSQASRRAPGGGGPPQSNQPPRRQRRGRRRRGVYDEEAESRPSRSAVAEPNVVQINSGSTVKDVAEYLSVPVPEVMKKLMTLGEMKTLTQTLSDDSINVLAAELGKDVEIIHSEDETIAKPVFNDAESDLVERPPVVTIMGHVDHGKTSLLDAIRETSVAAGEAGGITQHIGAYQVHHDGRTVTFLDTPGHEAFTAMRARGAKVTDIAVIVVAADDGVKPQTQEAVDHAKEAAVPILVAVNKIDKEGAQPDRVRTEMTKLGLQPVEWGGDTEFVNVSAKTREGLDDLLETIIVMSEVEELRANPATAASGTVIESKLDPGRGPVVTILIGRGTLEVGDALVAGAHWGRVRAMHDFLGTRIAQALPGEPVEVLGFDGVPEAGEHVRVVEHERRARQLAGERATRLKTESLARRSGKRVSLEDIFKSGIQELNLVIKSDVAGSLEAIEDEIAKLPQDEVSVNVIRRAVGAVTESDVMLAAASDAVILSFNVRPVGDARAVAEREGVEIRHYSVIYRAIDELRSAMQGMLAPEEVEETLGSAEVRQIFRASRVGTIAGSHVTEGKITRGSKVRLVRDGTVVFDGEIASLRRFNEDVREVASGFECGIVLKDFADVKEGDVLETYTTRQVERELV
jgi:translation initiation factor IF-2